MLTSTGAWSKPAPGGVRSSVMVTVTVGVDVLPLPLAAHGDWSAAPPPLGPPLPVPIPPPLGQLATFPTNSMRPLEIEVLLGSTIDTASPSFTRYSSLPS